MNEIKIEIWCKQDLRSGAKVKKVFEGVVNAVPRIGETVTIYDGWASDFVLSVDHEVYSKNIVVTIGPDYGDEYPAVP